MCTQMTWQSEHHHSPVKGKFATERPATPKRRKHCSWLLAAALHCRSSAAGTAASAAATTAAVIAAVNAATAIAIITAITIGTGATSTAAVTHHRYHRRCPRHHCRSRQHRRIRRSSSLRDSHRHRRRLHRHRRPSLPPQLPLGAAAARSGCSCHMRRAARLGRPSRGL